MYSTGITGQSSGRTKCVTPNVYQSTTSVSAIGRSGRGPAREAVAAGVLVREVAGGASFVGGVGRDPEVVAREAGAPADARIGRRRACVGVDIVGTSL